MHIGSYLVMYSVLAALETSGYQAPLVRTGDFGRSSYLITEEHLRFLLSCGFGTMQIAEILDVSVSTVKRRLRYEQQLQGVHKILCSFVNLFTRFLFSILLYVQ